jgi:hypothetical protein
LFARFAFPDERFQIFGTPLAIILLQKLQLWAGAQNTDNYYAVGITIRCGRCRHVLRTGLNALSSD